MNIGCFSGTPTSAVFQATLVKSSIGGDVDINVFGLNNSESNENWNASTITYSNAPAQSEESNTVNTNEAVFLGQFHLTNLVANVETNILCTLEEVSPGALVGFLALDTNQSVTFILTHTKLYKSADFASTENETSDGPQLTVQGVTAVNQLIFDPALVLLDEGGVGTVDIYPLMPVEQAVTVTVERISGDEDLFLTEGGNPVDSVELVYTPTDSSNRTVTLQSAEDNLDAGDDIALFRCTPSAEIALREFTVRSFDNDEAEIVVLDDDYFRDERLIEPGITNDVCIRLSMPAGDVTVSVSRVSGSTDIDLVGSSDFVFTSANWNQLQTVRVAVASSVPCGETAAFECTSEGAESAEFEIIAGTTDWNYLPISGTAYRILLGDTTGDGTSELLYATYQGSVGCVDTATKTVLWESYSSRRSYPYDFEVRDVTGDGLAETFLAASEGWYCFAPDGSTNWFIEATGHGLRSVASMDLGAEFLVALGGGPVNVQFVNPTNGMVVWDGRPTGDGGGNVRGSSQRLCAGDFVGGDGIEELYFSDMGGGWNGLLQMQTSPDYEGQMIRIAPYATFPSRYHSIRKADFDQDGVPEVFAGNSFGEGKPTHSVMAICATNSQKIALGANHAGYDDFFSVPYPAFYDLYADGDHPGLEIFSVVAGHLRVYSFTTNYYAGNDTYTPVINIQNKPMGFCDSVADPDSGVLYLGSIPGSADATVYRIDLTDPDWTNVYMALDRRGEAKNLRDALLTTEETIKNRPDSLIQRENPYMFCAKSSNQPDPALEEYNYRFSDGRLFCEYWEQEYAGFSGNYDLQEVLHLAKTYKEENRNLLLTVDHGYAFVRPDAVYVYPDFADALAEAGGNSLKGFGTSESGVGTTPATRYFYGPVVKWCRDNDRFFYMNYKRRFWLWDCASPYVYEKIFGEGRGMHLIPMTEDSNTANHECSFLALSSGRYGCLLQHYIVSNITDAYNADNNLYKSCIHRSGSPFLRKLMAQILIGANGVRERMQNKPLNRSSMELALRMVGKGLIFSPQQHEIVNVCPVGIITHEPAGNWNSSTNSVFAERANGSIGFQTVHSNGMERIFLAKDRHAAAQILPRPWGIPIFLPEASNPRRRAPAVKQWFHSDGATLWGVEGEPHMTRDEAATTVRAALQNWKDELAFRYVGDDIFFSILQPEGTNAYWIYAIDPEMLDPKTRTISIIEQLPGNFTYTDRISGETLSLSPTNTLDITVPAGLFRMIEAQPVIPRSLVLSTTNLVVDEGQTNVFYVHLDGAPLQSVQPVDINWVFDDIENDVTVHTTQLVFTASDWAVAKPVYVSAGFDNDTADGTGRILLRSRGIPSRPVDVSENDDGLGIRLSASPDRLFVPENGTNTVWVSMNAEPASNITVLIERHSGDSDITVSEGASLLFTPGNWSNAQPVVIAAASDIDILDGTAVFRACMMPNGFFREFIAEEEDDAPSILIDFGLTNSPVPSVLGTWNYISSIEEGTSISNAFYSDGTPSSLSLELTEAFEEQTEDTFYNTKHMPDILAPKAKDPLFLDAAHLDGFHTYRAVPGHLRLTGLDTSKVYRIDAYMSSRDGNRTTALSTDNEVIRARIGDQPLKTSGNSSFKGIRSFWDVLPGNDGTLDLHLYPWSSTATGGLDAHFGVLEIEWPEGGGTTTCRFDFGSSAMISTGNWNNITSTSDGTFIQNPIDSEGNPVTDFRIELDGAFAGIDTNGIAGTAYPDTAQCDSMTVNTNHLVVLRLSGLPQTNCTLRFFGSSPSFPSTTIAGILPEYRHTAGETQTVEATANTTREISLGGPLGGVAPKADGTIDLEIEATNGSLYGDLNVLTISTGDVLGGFMGSEWLTESSLGTNIIRIDCGVSNLLSSGNWNNLADCTIGASLSNLVETNGTATSIGIEVVGGFTDASINGYRFGHYPGDATRDCFGIGKSYNTLSYQGTVTISGLNPSNYYAVYFYGQNAQYTKDGQTRYGIAGLSGILETKFNLYDDQRVCCQFVPQDSDEEAWVQNVLDWGWINVMEIRSEPGSAGYVPAAEVESIELSVPEGSGANLRIRLADQPLSSTTVTVTRISGDTDLSAGGSLVFAPTNWLLYQELEITAAEDDGDELNGEAVYEVHAMGSTETTLVTAVEIDNDAAAPVWDSGYPRSDNILNTGFDIEAAIDENGTVWCVVLDDGVPAPSAYQVRDGRDADGVLQLAAHRCELAMNASVENTHTFSGLAVGTAYDVYLVAADANGYLQDSPVKIDVMTTSAGDSDADGLPDAWEMEHFGNLDANPGNLAANGLNTVMECYIAGLDPTDPDALFIIAELDTSGPHPVVHWNGVSGRVYSVQWAEDLTEGLQMLATNIPWNSGSYTDSVHETENQNFYKLNVGLE